MKTILIILGIIALVIGVIFYYANYYWKRIAEEFTFPAPHVRRCRRCGAEQIFVKLSEDKTGIWTHGRNTKKALDRDCHCLRYIK